MAYPLAVYNDKCESRLVSNEQEELDADAAGFGAHPSESGATKQTILPTDADTLKAIEEAVTAERQRCAAIAHTWPTGQLVAREIAREIKKRPKPAPSPKAPAVKPLAPSVETVKAAGYTDEAAKAISEEEARKEAAGEPPYGTKEPATEVDANQADEQTIQASE